MRRIFFLFISTLVILLASETTAREKGLMTGMTEAHNTARKKVKVAPLTWSDDLAAHAREWAEYLVRENG